MSIKIYDGYRLRLANKSWALFANEVREQIVPLMEEELIKMVCDSAINAYHRRQLAQAGLLPEQPMMNRSAYSSIARNLDEYFKEMNEFSLMLFTDPEDTEWTYIITYGSNNWKKHFAEVFEKSHGLEEFGYWNNSDEPEGVSAEAWEERLDIWNRIGLSDYAPIECGLTVEMVSSTWYAMQAVEPIFGEPDSLEAEAGLTALTAKSDFIERRSKRLAVDVDSYEHFAEVKADPSDIIAFLSNKSRTEHRQLLARQIAEIITIPTWEDLIIAPKTVLLPYARFGR